MERWRKQPAGDAALRQQSRERKAYEDSPLSNAFLFC